MRTTIRGNSNPIFLMLTITAVLQSINEKLKKLYLLQFHVVHKENIKLVSFINDDLLLIWADKTSGKSLKCRTHHTKMWHRTVLVIMQNPNPKVFIL